MSNDPRYEVKNETVEKMLKEIGAMLGSVCPPGWGFALQIFEFKGESFFYISNAQREDMIKALREFINREQ